LPSLAFSQWPTKSGVGFFAALDAAGQFGKTCNSEDGHERTKHG
jgi:hypothetical protein